MSYAAQSGAPYSSTTTRFRRQRCGKCEKCLRDDCGECSSCLKKVKFGGNGDCKSACILRKCEDMVFTIVSSSRSKSKRVKPACNDINKEDSKYINMESIVCKTRYGLPVLKNQGLCAACCGSRNEEAKDEPILLCDGDGCNREFHLGCVEPPLAEVPEGDFFCQNCDDLGTSYDLMKYFEECQESRAEFTCSRDYVLSLIHNSLKNIEESDEENETLEPMRGEGNGKSSEKSKSNEEINTDEIPSSELSRISELHEKALTDFTSAPHINGRGATSAKKRKTCKLEASFLVGKPLRLYCHQCSKILFPIEM